MNYLIKLKGRLRPALSDWFADCRIEATPAGDTLLIGDLPDAAALYGLLARCRDYGLELIALSPLPAEGENYENCPCRINPPDQCPRADDL
ncbi:MAG: hypothetical protein KDE34_13750 [Anaerolineales bacterium]|nr:hypothetical protein [Anaerolineales bacterium]